MNGAAAMRDLLARAERAGCTVHRTRRNHYAIRLPGGGIVFAPSTPSDWRGLLNTRAHLRRAGVPL